MAPAIVCTRRYANAKTARVITTTTPTMPHVRPPWIGVGSSLRTLRRESIAKEVSNATSLKGEQHREEHRQAPHQHGGDEAPRTHHAIVPQPSNGLPHAISARITNASVSPLRVRKCGRSQSSVGADSRCRKAKEQGLVSCIGHPDLAGESEIEVPKKRAAVADKPARSMSDSHKEALAVGREQGRAVRRYLEALEANKPRRGRKRTAEGIQKRLTVIEERLASADALSRLHLAQERMDLKAELAASGDGGVDLEALEAEFVQAAGPYSARKGITYDAWRMAGVEPRVLKAAGLSRGQ